MKKLSNLLGTEVYSQLLWLRCSYIKLPPEIMGLSHMRTVAAELSDWYCNLRCLSSKCEAAWSHLSPENLSRH